MPSRSKFLNTLIQKKCNCTEKTVSLNFIKDAIITQLQPMFGSEIQDVFIGDLPDPVVMKIFTRKEVRRKK